MNEQERMVLALWALQLDMQIADEGYLQVLKLTTREEVAQVKQQAQALLEQGMVVCEMCGEMFPARESIFVELGEYIYCEKCCHW